jgi:hypothetical protein
MLKPQPHTLNTLATRAIPIRTMTVQTPLVRPISHQPFILRFPTPHSDQTPKRLESYPSRAFGHTKAIPLPLAQEGMEKTPRWERIDLDQ